MEQTKAVEKRFPSKLFYAGRMGPALGAHYAVDIPSPWEASRLTVLRVSVGRPSHGLGYTHPCGRLLMPQSTGRPFHGLGYLSPRGGLPMDWGTRVHGEASPWTGVPPQSIVMTFHGLGWEASPWIGAPQSTGMTLHGLGCPGPWGPIPLGLGYPSMWERIPIYGGRSVHGNRCGIWEYIPIYGDSPVCVNAFPYTGVHQ
jgi:hypothetical protein